MLLRTLLKELCRTFAWISCTSSDVDGSVLASVLLQLERIGKPTGNEKMTDNTYINSMDFLDKLPGIDLFCN